MVDSCQAMQDITAVADAPLSLRDEHSEATRRALIASAREAYGSVGYHEAGIESLARAARVTRGALYHHFKDKKALFDAVVVQMQEEAVAEIERRAAAKRDPWTQFVEGVEAYFEICQRRAYRRIVLEDAPAALGRARMAAIDNEYPLGWLKTKLRALQKAGVVANLNTATLAALLAAMVSEGAAMLSTRDREASREQVHATLHTLLDGVRVRGAKRRRR